MSTLGQSPCRSPELGGAGCAHLETHHGLPDEAEGSSESVEDLLFSIVPGINTEKGLQALTFEPVVGI